MDKQVKFNLKENRNNIHFWASSLRDTHTEQIWRKMFASQQLAGHNIFPTWNMRQPMSPTTQHVISYEKKTVTYNRKAVTTEMWILM